MELEKSKENNIRRTRETIIWINIKEHIFFNQDLKNQEVDSKVRDRKENGAKSTNILIRMYLKE